MKPILLLIALVTITACNPTAQQIQSANYGPFPADRVEIIKNFMADRLVDPESARYSGFTTPYQGYVREFADIYWGWIVEVDINAKNRIGGYVGRKRYRFVIKNDRVINYGLAI